MTKAQFLDRVRERDALISDRVAERAAKAVFQTLKEALQSEELEDRIDERLSPGLRELWEEPILPPDEVRRLFSFLEDDVVEEGHEPEEVAIPVREES